MKNQERNEKCNCNSGLKYKKCCMNNSSAVAVEEVKVGKTASTKSEKVLALYPSFEEIKEKMLVKCKPNRALYNMIKCQSLNWEGLIWGINQCLNHMMGHSLQETYNIQNSKTNEGIDANGYAVVNTAYYGTKEINATDFLAIVKIMACSWFEIPTDRKAYEAYLSFKASNTNIYQILD